MIFNFWRSVHSIVVHGTEVIVSFNERKQTRVNEAHQSRLKRFPAGCLVSDSALWTDPFCRPGSEVNLSN